jgi:hypothetical protein
MSLFKRRTSVSLPFDPENDFHLLGIDSREYESLLGSENELLTFSGKPGYTSQVFETDRFYIQIVFFEDRATTKIYLDRTGSITAKYAQQIIDDNLGKFNESRKIFSPKNKQITFLNRQRTKLVTMTYSSISKEDRIAFTGHYPLKRILVSIDPTVISSIRSKAKLKLKFVRRRR